ncbi:haloacid dehalogenase-like hydrolase [Paractinoplanes ferrugineus]|uniref:Haloacid dehalogenase n=1 Tax=Paractinoplanes ferrugineus TaxID=113564 RepID=A0A919J7T3_9ACTN|nr:haloacid dehalogenase-like hydrolase [Actinoplanes ferrugineus]GIE14214.1 haloacid dehalogenase [Actinoplanes ferrugineus]
MNLVAWDLDGTLIPADLRWLRRAISRTYELAESAVVFPEAKVHGYTDDSIVVDTAIRSGVERGAAEAGIPQFHQLLSQVMADGRDELARDQPPYPGAQETIRSLHDAGFIQTVLTGNLRSAAEIKLTVAGLDDGLDLRIGGFGSDARDRFDLPAVVEQRFSAVYGRRLRPSSTVIIGDAVNDIACARHAGFHVIVVAHRVTREELAHHQPDAILDSLNAQQVVAAVTELTNPT